MTPGERGANIQGVKVDTEFIVNLVLAFATARCLEFQWGTLERAW